METHGGVFVRQHCEITGEDAFSESIAATFRSVFREWLGRGWKAERLFEGTGADCDGVDNDVWWNGGEPVLIVVSLEGHCGLIGVFSSFRGTVWRPFVFAPRSSGE
jgi:hypothetical protein